MNTENETKADIFADTPGTDDYHEFWNNIENITCFVVPTYLRNVLKFHGFDSAMSVKLIDEDDLKAIENFVTSGGMLRTLKSDVDLADFYGPFVESLSDFRILAGHRKVLLGISALIREKELQFFSNDPKPVINNVARRGRIDDCDTQNTEDSTNSTGSLSSMTPTTTMSESKTSLLAPNQMVNTSKNVISSEMKKRDREMPKITVRRNGVLMHRKPYTIGKPQNGRNAISKWI